MNIKTKLNKAKILQSILSPHALFLIIGIPLVLLFANIGQPGWGLDEQVHGARAWQVSRLVAYPQLTTGGFYGGSIPRPLADLLNQGHADSNGVNRAANFFEREDLKNPNTYNTLKAVKITATTPMVTYNFGPTGAYNPLPYVPAAVGMRIASLFDASVGVHFALAKFINAAVYIGIVFLALRYAYATKVKWLIFVVALLPTSLYQASIITADTFSIAVVLLFASVLLTTLINKVKIDKKTAWFLTGSSLLLVFTKVNYVLFLSLLLLIPISKYNVSTKNAKLIKIFTFVSLVVLSMLVTLLSLRYVSATGYGGDVSSIEQLKWVIFNPVEFMFVLIRTIVIFGQGWLISIVGLFGYNTVAVPNILSSLYFVVIFLAALYADPISKKTAWLILGVSVATCLSVIGVLYLSFTPVGHFIVNGIQGRYFLPCVPLLAYGLAKVLPFELSIAKAKTNTPLIFGGSALIIGVIAITVYGFSMYSY